MSNKKNKQHILIVDDQPEMRKSINRILRMAGFDCVEAADGKEALAIIKSQTIDLIISDLRMPVMDGIEFLHCMRREFSIPFILMTGYSEVIEAAEAYEMGVDGFLQKPFKQPDLLQSVTEAFNSRLQGSKNQLIESNKAINDQFCGIPVDEFLTGREIKFPIYLKLSDSKFIKMALSGEDLTADKIVPLKNKKVKFFYLLREDFKNYISFASKITESILSSNKINASKKAAFLKHSSEVILSFGFQQYVDKEIFELAKINVEQSLSLLTDNKSFLEILNALTTHSTALYKHSMAVSLISCLTAKSMGWGSSPLFFRLVSSSIFHDLGKQSLPPALLSIPLSEMSAEDAQLYKTHPKLGAEKLAAIEGLPSEIMQIVQHHHELCDGSGYPEGLLSSKIHPVAKVISAADEFVKLYQGAPGYGEGMGPKRAIYEMEKINKVKKQSYPKWESLPALKKVFDPS